jgi:hypothetical protein
MSCTFKPATVFVSRTTKTDTYFPARLDRTDHQKYIAASVTSWHDDHRDIISPIFVSKKSKKAESILYAPIDKDHHFDFNYSATLAHDCNKKVILK